MKHLGWPWLLALQALAASLLTALAVLSLAAGPVAAGPVYELTMWGAVPLSGALTACFAARRGVTGYALFFLPPIFQTAVHWLLLGVPPASVFMPLAAAALSLAGAAAGEELLRRGGKKRKKRQKK